MSFTELAELLSKSLGRPRAPVGGLSSALLKEDVIAKRLATAGGVEIQACDMLRKRFTAPKVEPANFEQVTSRIAKMQKAGGETLDDLFEASPPPIKPGADVRSAADQLSAIDWDSKIVAEAKAERIDLCADQYGMLYYSGVPSELLRVELKLHTRDVADALDRVDEPPSGKPWMMDVALQRP